MPSESGKSALPTGKTPSKRELEALGWRSSGLSSVESAARMGVSKRRVNQLLAPWPIESEAEVPATDTGSAPGRPQRARQALPRDAKGRITGKKEEPYRRPIPSIERDMEERGFVKTGEIQVDLGPSMRARDDERIERDRARRRGYTHFSHRLPDGSTSEPMPL